MDAEASMERFQEVRFKREYTIFRQGQFTPNKIFELDKRTELPHNSIIHVFDNISHMTEDPQDIPRLEECPLIDRESFRKFIYHIKNFNLEGPLHYEDKFIFRQSGLPARLLKFRTQHGSRFRYPLTIEELPARREALCIINHNPLFRARFFGRLQTFRKLTLIWTSILNTVCSLKHLEKNQFIYIPWGPEVYPKNLFIKNRDKLTIATVRYPEDPHYFIMMHLINYMWSDATTSLFSQIPEDVLPQVNIILTINGKYLIFNLAVIKELNDKNRVYFKFINLLNMLSIFGTSEEHPEEVKKLIDRHFVESEVSPSTTESEGIVSTIEPRASVNEKEKEDTSVSDTVDQAVDTAINTIASALPKKIIKPAVSPVVAAAAPVETPPLSKNDIKTKVQDKVKKNITTASNHTPDNIKPVVVEYVNEGDEIAAKFIEEQEHLTGPQRKRYTALATKYKTLEIEGKSLEKILTTEDDISIEPFAVDPNKVGDIPDKSACESSIVSLDKSYMTKSFNRHLVETITSFRKQGVFLTDIKTKHEVDRMNNFMHYTLHYEDINGKKSTVKFRVPQPTRDGRIKIDGLYSVLKKQRINLPIIKISDTEVSLASNYNKTRVERNVTKAHSYFEYVDGLINSNKSTAQIQFGKCLTNLPLPYEYSIIGEHYRSIEFAKDKVNWKLWFDYKDRSDHFDGKEDKMLLLEKEYGTYFGNTNDQWLFIDSNCQVRAVFKSNGEDPNFQCNTLFDIFKLALRDEADAPKKSLTEYVTIKILDKMLPVIFLLGFQYGLRNTLDYLGIKYTITETRGRTIVGESGNESFSGIMVGNEGFFSAISKLSRKLFYYLTTPMVAMQKWIIKKWHKDEPDDPHLWKVSIFCEPTSDKKKFKIVSIVLTILPKAGAKFTFRLFSKFNNKIIDRDKQMFMDPLASQIASALKVHVRNIALADKKVAKDGKLPSNYKNTKEVTSAELTQLSTHATMRDAYFKQVAKHQNIAGLADFDSYHITKNIELVKKYGLLSPRDLYEKDRDLFHNTSYPKYRERAVVFHHKTSITDEDILNYLDKSPKRIPLSSRSIFWSFLPSSDMPLIPKDGYELSASLDTIKKYSLGNPILVDGPRLKQVSWDEFKNIYDDSIANAKKGAEEPIKNGFLYGKILHFAVDSKPIPYKEFDSTTALSDSETSGDSIPIDELPVLKYGDVYPYFKQVLKEYKNIFDISVANLKMEMSEMPIDTYGRPANFPKNQFGACWTLKGIVYVNPYFREPCAFFSGKNELSLEEFYNSLHQVLAHEVAHEIWNNIAKDTFKESILNKAKNENFTTDYLDHYDKSKPKYREEIFCEYLSTKLVSKVKVNEDTDDEETTNTSLVKGLTDTVSVTDLGAKKYMPQSGDIAIKFSDRILWFNRYPLEKSLIVSGLDYFDCSQYSLADLESKDVYYQMLTDRNMSTNYLKGIASFFDLFVDGMTYEVLKKMNEPTTFRDLLIRAAQLLSTTDHLPASAKANHRIRGFEQYNAIIYNEMSRQFAAYQSKRGQANSFSINPDAIFLRIISNESMVASEGTNPLQCTRESSYMTYSGIGGRSADSFVLRDRAYADDDIGIISEATVDNTKVSINAMLSMNSGVKDTLGTLEAKPLDDMQPADVLTNQVLMFPFSTHDDK